MASRLLSGELGLIQAVRPLCLDTAHHSPDKLRTLSRAYVNCFLFLTEVLIFINCLDLLLRARH